MHQPCTMSPVQTETLHATHPGCLLMSLEGSRTGTSVADRRTKTGVCVRFQYLEHHRCCCSKTQKTGVAVDWVGLAAVGLAAAAALEEDWVTAAAASEAGWVGGAAAVETAAAEPAT